ncbi:MAG: hypothetical protein HGA31_02570 [Candidatus Moranbacteria bacterium]|nr:hypothetical protein [Candidatus Moranbacteria bacterium]
MGTYESFVPKEVSENRPPVFDKRFGMRSYRVYEGDVEKLDRWFSEMESIYESLRDKNLEALAPLVDTNNLRFNTRGIEPDVAGRMIEDMNFSEEALKMQAVSLWILTHRPRWKGSLDVVKRFTLGGEQELSSFMKRDGEPNCLDTAILSDYFSKRFGVQGEMKDTLKEFKERGIRFLHWYWQSDSGIVMDTWEGYERLGIFKNDDEYKEQRVTDTPLPHLCG